MTNIRSQKSILPSLALPLARVRRGATLMRDLADFTVVGHEAVALRFHIRKLSINHRRESRFGVEKPRLLKQFFIPESQILRILGVFIDPCFLTPYMPFDR